MVDLATGKVSAVAAQARWRSAQGILFTPAEFLRVADDSDRTAELGRWLLEEAVAQAAERAQGRPRVAVSVRLSARRLLDKSMPIGAVAGRC